MARRPKPWYRRERRCWFVTIEGKQYNLGPDKATAERRFHELMAQPRPVKPEIQFDSVIAITDVFLDWCQKNQHSGTYEWYRTRLQNFVETIPASLSVSEMKPFYIQSWIDSHPAWSDGNKRNACRSIQRVMNWATEQGYIDRSPIAYLKKPKAGRREQVVN